MTTQTVSHAKPKAAKKPTKQEAAAAAVAKMRQASLNIPVPSAPPSELAMVPTTLITTRKQVRTEFDQASLAELAADIAARGMLQPILLRPLPPNPGTASYLVIAGERRLLAARLAKLDAVPALIGEVDDDTASMMQIAENIQREDLSLADEATYVRKLYDLVGGSVTAAAERLHKSKAWVSKRLAASCPNLADQARRLLEDGVTEDLEIVLTVDKIAELDYYAANQIADAVTAGQAGRQTVREKLDQVKSEIEAKKAEQERLAEEKNSPEAEAKREKEAQERIAEQKKEIERKRLDPNQLIWMYDEELDDEQKLVLAKHLMEIYMRGKKDTGMIRLIKTMEICCNNTAAIEVAAYVAGSQGMEFNLAQLIDVTSEAEQA